MEKRLTTMPTTKSGRASRAARKLGGVNGVVQLMMTSSGLVHRWFPALSHSARAEPGAQRETLTCGHRADAHSSDFTVGDRSYRSAAPWIQGSASRHPQIDVSTTQTRRLDPYLLRLCIRSRSGPGSLRYA
jgi:hypothetical protein